MILLLSSYEPAAEEKLQKIIAECKEITELAEDDCFQFIQEQFELILKSAKGRHYSENVLIFASQLLCTSPTAYRLLRNSCCILLPQKLVHDLMNKSFQNDNLCTLFDSLKPEQRLVNVLFDEVKLKSTMRYSNSHVVGHSSNRINKLATHALVVEIVCYFGGPRLVLSITPGLNINAPRLKALIDEALWAIREKGGTPIVVVCDNCPLNKGIYKLFLGEGGGGGGKVQISDLI